MTKLRFCALERIERVVNDKLIIQNFIKMKKLMLGIVLILGIFINFKTNTSNNSHESANFTLGNLLLIAQASEERDPDDDSCMYYHWFFGLLPGTYINCEMGTLWCVQSECS